MRLVTPKPIILPGNGAFRIHHLTDLHDGSPAHAEAELDARIEEIRVDPFARWIGGGDYGDLIVPGDKRYTGDVPAEDYRLVAHRIPDYYLERLERRLKPIADKCLGLGKGNHEVTIEKNYHRGVTAELAAKLGVPGLYMDYRGWSIVTVTNGTKKVHLKLYQHHGWSGGRLKGRKPLQDERDLGARDAHVFFLGHDHQPFSTLWYTQDAYQRAGAWVLRNVPRAVINGGAWTREHQDASIEGTPFSQVPNTAWSSTKNYRPEGIGGPILTVHVDFADGSTRDRAAGFDFEITTRGSRLELAA